MTASSRSKAGKLRTLLSTTGLSIRRTYEDDCFTHSAAIAYYGIVSLFPLLLLLIGVMGFFLEEEDTRRRLLAWASRYFPTGSRAVLRENIDSIVAARDSISLLSLGGLLWSATLMFDAVTVAVNTAWRTSQGVAFLAAKLRSLVVVSLMTLIVLMSTLLTTQAALISRFEHFMSGIIWLEGSRRLGAFFAGTGSSLLSLGLAFAAFVLAYRFLPRAEVRLRDVWLGAMLAALIWETTKRVFVWYVTGFANYTQVYGSLSAVLVLLVWTYLSATILIWGAEFAAVTAERRRAPAGGAGG